MKRPQLRFPGFTDDWEQCKLSELSDFITKGATPTTYGYDWQKSGIPFFRNDAIKDNQFVYGDFSYISEEANEALKRSEIQGDDILVAISGDIGKAGIVPKTVEKGNINQHTARVRIIKDAVPYFIYQSLITENQQRKYKLIKTGLSMPQLSLEQIRDTIVLCPNIEEQKKIGDFYYNLDNLITLHQRKCDNLKELKKAMLSKMFPKDGEKSPEVRFPGFNDDWEQRKLSETKTFFTDGNYGEAYPKSTDMVDSAIGVPFLTGGNLKDGKLDITGASYISKEKHELLTSGHLIEDDIVIAVRGSLGALGYVNAENSDWNINSQLAILRTDKEEISGKFLLQYLLSYNGQKELIRRQTGTALKQLPIGAIKDVSIPITSVDEQAKIGAYFSNLDILITLHQRKLDYWREMKKAMLQRMFV